MIRRFVQNAVVFAATLCVLELALRYVLGGMEHVALYDPGSTVQSCGGLRPGATVDYTGWFLRLAPVRQEVNALGYRGPQRPTAKPDGVLRIAAVGDSYTYGLGVAAPDAIPARLETRLRDVTGKPIEVLNFGVPGSALEDTIVRVREFAARWSPDLVLYFLFADDLDRPLCRWKETNALAMRLMTGQFADVAAHPADVAHLVFGLLSWKSYVVRAGTLVWRFAPMWLPARDDGAWTGPLGAQLRALADASRPAREGLVVVALGDPSYHRSPRLGEVMASAHVTWLDARGWLFGRPEERLPIIPGDQHFTAAGNDRAAAAVASWLVEQQLDRTP